MSSDAVTLYSQLLEFLKQKQAINIAHHIAEVPLTESSYSAAMNILAALVHCKVSMLVPQLVGFSQFSEQWLVRFVEMIISELALELKQLFRENCIDNQDNTIF